MAQPANELPRRPGGSGCLLGAFEASLCGRTTGNVKECWFERADEGRWSLRQGREGSRCRKSGSDREAQVRSERIQCLVGLFRCHSAPRRVWMARDGGMAPLISALGIGLLQLIWVQTSHTCYLRSSYASDSSSGCISDRFYGSYRHIRLRFG